MTEELLNRPYWVIDFLPEQVPEQSEGQYFAVEEYYLRPPALDEMHRRFTGVLLKLNCYYDFQVFAPDEGLRILNPAPERLYFRINTERKDLCVLLPGENALITLNRDDLYMTVYNPAEKLLNRLERLAASEGLFLRRPEQG